MDLDCFVFSRVNGTPDSACIETGLGVDTA